MAVGSGVSSRRGGISHIITQRIT